MALPGCAKQNNDPKEVTPTDTTPTQTAADPNKPRDGGTFTVGTFTDIVKVSPLFYDDTSSGDIVYLTMAQLYDVSPKGDIEVTERSIAAELPKVSADGLVWTIKLKSTPKWSDGSPLTAEDVAFTFSTIANKDAASPNYPYFASVKEAKALDPTTVQITLKEVDARFELNTMTINPVPAKVYKGIKPEEMDKQAFGTDPKQTLYSGPYIWTEWVEKQYIKVVRNPNYWGKKPNIETIIVKVYADQTTEIQALMKGEIDYVSAIPVAQLDAVKGDKKINIVEGPGVSYDYVGYNFKPENWPGGFVPFAGAKTRQAIAYAVNRKGMIDAVLRGHGVQLNGPFLPGSWTDTPGAAFNYPYDSAKAKALLAEDGWKPGSDGILVKDGRKFEFELLTNSGNNRRESYAAIIQQNLAEVGIKVNIKPVEFATLIDQYMDVGKYQALLLGWQLGLEPDAESIFSSEYFVPAGQNYGYYKNTKTDKLWKDGYANTDKKKRQQIYAEICKEFNNDPPYMFIAQQNGIMGHNVRVHYAKENGPIPALPYGYFFHIFDWWVTD